MAEWPKWVWDEDFLDGTPEEQLAEEVRNASAGVLPDGFDPRYMHSEVIPADLGRELAEAARAVKEEQESIHEETTSTPRLAAALARYEREVGDA